MVASGRIAGVTVIDAHATAGPQMATVLEASVTAPLRARARPLKVVPVFMVMLESARMLPTNVVPVPSVAELPICQKTCGGRVWLPALMTATDDPDAVVSVEPVWKMNSASGLPWKSRVNVPVRNAELSKQ